MTAVEEREAKPIRTSMVWWKPDISELQFTFHLRLAYCLRKFSKLTTDSLFTSACLELRGCRDTTREETAEYSSVMFMSNTEAGRHFVQVCVSMWHCNLGSKKSHHDSLYIMNDGVLFQCFGNGERWRCARQRPSYNVYKVCTCVLRY